MSALPASAYTVDDLVTTPERAAIANYSPYAYCKGADAYYTTGYNWWTGQSYAEWTDKAVSMDKVATNHSEGITIERESDESVIIRGIGRNDWAFRFYLTDGKGNKVSDGEYLTHYYDDPCIDNPMWRLYGKSSSFKTSLDLETYGAVLESQISLSDWTLHIGETGVSEYPTQITSKYTDRSTSTGNHGMVIAYRSPCPQDEGAGGWNVRNNSRGYYSIMIEYYRPNAEATDNFRTYKATVKTQEEEKTTLDITEKDRSYRQYPMLVEWEGNQIYLTNLGNNGNGFNFDPSIFRIKATLNNDNSITFAQKQKCRTYSYYEVGWFSTRYYLDGVAYCDSIYTYEDAFEPLYWLEGFYHEDAVENEGECRDELLGSYIPEELAHNNERYGWVTPANRGKRKTFNDFRIHVNPYTYYYPVLLDDVVNFAGAYFDTDIQGNKDVTLDVDLVLDAIQWNSEQGVYAVGHIHTNKNYEYVDHYDVMIVKGKWDHIEQNHPVHGQFLPCNTNGHEHASVLCDHAGDAHNIWNKQKVVARASSFEPGCEHDYQFAKLIYPHELHEGTVEDGGYTVFIRANYKAETGLTPTFHSLQYIDNPIQTGVIDTTVQNVAKVSVSDGRIRISGSEEQAVVTSVSGAEVYRGLEREIAVGSGVYVVKVGDTVSKVVVR